MYESERENGIPCVEGENKISRMMFLYTCSFTWMDLDIWI